MERIHSSRVRKSTLSVALSLIFALTGVVLTACGGAPNGGLSEGRKELGSASEVAASTDDLKIAVHYVAFKDSAGAVISEATAKQMLGEASQKWAQCNISFALEKYDAIDPSSIGAQISPANYSELDFMREKLQTNSDLLVIATASWNRSGDLGNTGSNCFSSFPGDEAEGIVCEAGVLTNSLLLSHEVGHWLNLIHTDDPNADYVDDTTAANASVNLMSHFVSPSNNQLTPGQCARARSSIADSRRNAVLQ